MQCGRKAMFSAIIDLFLISSITVNNLPTNLSLPSDFLCFIESAGRNLADHSIACLAPPSASNIQG
jgi:hypothetical protein